MKTFLKLFAAVFVFGFASANAAYTDSQKAAAIKAVTDAVATGNEEAIKSAISEQVAAFPELAGDIVSAGLKVAGISKGIQILIVRVATWTAPDQLANIKVGINGSGLGATTIIELTALADRIATAANAASAAGNKSSLPPITAS